MSRWQLPPLAPQDLRQHDDADRVERIWRRVSADLPKPAVTRSRKPALFFAAAATFGGGLIAGSVLTQGVRENTAAEATNDLTETVFAAGTQERLFDIPGVGTLRLHPESTVEIVHDVARGEKLVSLLRGSAALETVGQHVTIIAGEATLATQAGSNVSIRRNASDLDVAVAGGSVEINSPAGRQVLASGQRVSSVPITPVVSILPDPDRARSPRHDHPLYDPKDPRSNSVVAEADLATKDPIVAEVATTPAAPSWYSRYGANDLVEAQKLVDQAGGLQATIESATSAGELLGLDELARRSKKPALGIRALNRIVVEFPNDPAMVAAAMSLSAFHRSAKNEGEAQRYEEIAARAPNSAFSDDVACRQLRAMDDGTVLTTEVEAAKAYLAKFEKGSCREVAESILQDAPPSDDPEKSTEPHGSDPKTPEDKGKAKPAESEKPKLDEKPATKPAPIAPPSQVPTPAPSSPSR